jgi:aldehyde dehydrogenase (NAD+)
VDEALAANAACEYGLTAAVFGPETEARQVAEKLRVGHVLINDVIAPTADPRVSFGGRGMSGYGVTRGAEGLLGMTTLKTTQVRRGRPKRAYEVTGEGHVELFAGFTQLLHGSWNRRLTGMRRLMAAVRELR